MCCWILGLGNKEFSAVNRVSQTFIKAFFWGGGGGGRGDHTHTHIHTDIYIKLSMIFSFLQLLFDEVTTAQQIFTTFEA